MQFLNAVGLGRADVKDHVGEVVKSAGLSPVSVMTFSPSAFAAFAARTTFSELPEVLIPRKTSPGLPSERRACA